MAVPGTAWFPGITRRPVLVWIPTPGPVAYHVQSACFTLAVMSTGADHVTPSSVLRNTATDRPAWLVPAMMSFSRSVPRFCVVSSQMVPVVRSTTGQGLPKVFGPLSPTTWSGDHVWPPSRLRFSTRSMSPASPPPSRLASAKASSVPRAVAMTDGMRNVL